MMVLRLAIIAGLACLAAAGPIAWDDSKCAQKCNAGTKYQYSERTTYIYSYESTNEMKADGASELSMGMKATIKITAISKCEMILQISDVTLQHGPVEESTSPFIEELKRNPLPFSWNDGTVEHVCPSPDDSNDVNNIKKAIISAFQNTMRSFEFNAYEKEVDVLGSCDTEYIVKTNSNDKVILMKNKKIETCTDHLKHQTFLVASFYESASQRQHLALLSGEKLSCRQNIDAGVVDEVVCEENAAFKPLSDYGYVVETKGNIKIKKLSSQPSDGVQYRTPQKESLVFKFNPQARKNENLEAELQNQLRQICENTAELISKNAANSVHKLVYLIRGISEESLERTYQSLKSKQLCQSGKALTIFLDALKAASSGGSVGLLSKLVLSGDISEVDSILWMTTVMPFTSYLEEQSIAAAVPLLKKDSAKKQALLGVSSMTYKYCKTHDDCKDSSAVKEVSASLKQFLGDKCQTANGDEESKIITALKSFGNLGYIGKSADSILECAVLSSNKLSVRISAVEAFRRTACTEETVSKILDLYKNRNDEDEVRIAALISLSRCVTPEVISNVVDAYSSETSKQVQVFTWSYLENLRSSSDPLKSKLVEFPYDFDIKAPLSTDITKFSRNFESSLFSEILNIGHGIEANLIHSKASFLPRSANLGLKANLFGNQLNLIEVGGRVEDLEHTFEKLFGPRGLMPNLELDDLLAMIPLNQEKRKKRSADSYKSKIDSLSERLAYSRGKTPHGSGYIRVLGHELGWIHLHKDMFTKYIEYDLEGLLRELASKSMIDKTRTLLYLDLSVLFPSVTGRAYKLASNGSITLGLKAEGKLDLQQNNSPLPQAHIEGRVQPSILSDMTASFTIHSENFEPGVRVETTLNAGLDFDTKVEVKDGRLLHVKLNRRQDKQEIVSLKRTIFSMNHRGVVEHAKPKSYDLNYCTTYVQQILGVKYCATASIPHVYNEEGKPKVPFVRALEASLVAEKTDKSMEGYEFLLELPELWAKERRFRILIDTPKSTVDRKLSLDFTLTKPDTETASAALKVYNPFYNLDVNADVTNRDDNFRMKVDAVADKKRRYAFLLDVVKDIKGSRLVEYQPKLSMIMHNMRPIELSGTVVFAKGRKEQITINLQSSSFDSPFLIKGNLAKEGGSIQLDSDWKLRSEMNITAFSQIHRLQSSLGNEEDNGVFLNVGHHYEPDGRSYESVTVNAKLENIELRDRLRFSLETEVLLAEHQDLNSKLRWDFSFKPFEHWKDEILFRYGENFNDERHVVHITHITAFHGDFDTFQQMDIENKLGLTISCFDFDKSAAFSVVWDFVDRPKFLVEAGIRTQKEREVSFKYNYRHVKQNPLTMKSESKFVYYGYTILHHNDVYEESPQNFKGKSVIENNEGKEIIIDYTYKIKDQGNFHHEFEGTVEFPDKLEPLKLKSVLSYTSDSLKLNSIADSGNGSPYTLDVKLQRAGESEVKFNTPFIDGNVAVQASDSVYSVQAELKEKSGKYDGKVVVTGTVSLQAVKTLSLDVLWDADKDSDKKMSIKAQSNKATEDGIDKHIISANINYAGSIDIVVTGKVSTDIIKGPHFFRADFSGNMEPMSIECTHEIKNGEVASFARYLRSDSEKLKLDMKGKYIFTRSRFEIESGLFLSSPYRTFDGKELYFRTMADSNEATRVFISEYRIKPAPVIGYVGKIDYERKRGFPGQIRSTLLVTVHQRPTYQGSTNIDYGNGKYSWKTSFTPITKKKINLLTSFEHSANFAAFHHSLATTLQYFQKVELNAVADLRNLEDAKVHTNLDINQHKLYDVNSTLKMRSLLDFEAELDMFSKISPSLRLVSKAQPNGQITKYDMTLNVDSVNLISGTGELKKRNKRFNGEISFNYKEREILILSISQEAKSQRERNYMIRVKSPLGQYSSNIKINKEKKGGVKYETKFCTNEADDCISVDAHHKEPGDTDEWQISYKRGDIDFIIERIRADTQELSRYHTVIYNGDKRYGYDLRLGKEGIGRSASLGLILPSREIVSKTYVEISFEKPRVKFEFSADASKNPDKKLVTDIKFENHLTDNNPSKLDVIITHPIFEKPIEMQLIGDYEPSQNKFLTAQLSVDYSNDPEDKLISKLSLEKSSTTGVATLDMYHKDDQHLDFKVKVNLTITDDDEYLGVFWNWKGDSNEDQEAHTILSSQNRGRNFLVEVIRPKINYRLDGVVVSPQSLLGALEEVDFTSTYNGEATKAKIIVNHEEGCYSLIVFNNQGEIRRNLKICVSDKSRKMLSMVMHNWNEEEEQMEFSFSVELVRKSWRMMNLRTNIDPQFLGSTLFQLSHFMGELEALGIGKPPFYESARYKKIKASIYSKLLQPAIRYVIPEAARFIADVRRDSIFLQAKVLDYYNSLPPLTEVKLKIEKVTSFIKTILREVWESVDSYYREYFKNVIIFTDKATGILKGMCDGNQDCKAFVRAFNERGLEGLCSQLKIFIRSLPGKFQDFMNQPGVDARKFYDKLVTLVKVVLQPLTKYQCGEIFVKLVQLTHQTLEPHIQNFLDNYPRYYKTVMQAITTNKYVVEATKLAKETYFKIREEVVKVDYERLYDLARKAVEEWLFKANPPSAEMLYKLNEFNSEKGVLDFDLPFGLSRSYPAKISIRLVKFLGDVVEHLISEYDEYSWQTLLVTFKRGADLNFFPPYEAQAMIVGNQHFVTFDKVFYDFAGECTYLLSRDFEDGNFTFALKPKEGDKSSSIIAFINDIRIELNSGEKSVSVADKQVELPYLSQDFTVSLSGSTLIIDDKHGVRVKCNLVHEICTFSISGWYFGKTAGLLGTYNYESSDEFKRPKGQIANSGVMLAKSWELKKGCKSNNLVTDVRINENSNYYKLCKTHFQERSSKLSACFNEVEPDEYFQLCLRHLARETDHTKSLCNVAAAYVMECERNYIELNLPSSCLTCSAPDGSTLQHGDRKKYEKLNKKSADVVFIVEDHNCNKVVLDDLANLARSIDRELQNDGYKDTMFGVVGYGGDIGDPQVYTVKEKSFFSSRDIGSIRDRIKLENAKSESSRAFEAMQLAVTYLFRSDTAKSFVLLSCSSCKYDYTSLQYPIVQQILLERGITLHVINNAEISTRKSSIKEKDIIGADPDTVYHSKDVTQKDLTGEPALRSQISLPKDLCVALSQDVSGSFFSTYQLGKVSSDIKNWRSVFSRKFLKSVQSFQCQWCDCTSTRDHIPNTVCQPCESKRPRLPFSVCKSCALPRTVESYLFYILQFIRK